mgnify:CR=1 FL=1
MASEPFVHVVDDDDAIRDSIGFLLSSSGLQWRSYSSARALLNRVGELEDGCIVTDVRMPEMTGLELVRELKHLGAPHPIVVLTGHADVALAVEAMKAGVDDFLEKPFQPEALLASITGETFTADYTRVDNLRIGGVAITGLPVAFAHPFFFTRLGMTRRPALLLGMDALRMFRRVAVDFPNRRAHFLLPDDAGRGPG